MTKPLGDLFAARYRAPDEYRGRGCPSAFVGDRDFYGEWLAWQIDLTKEALRGRA